MHSIKMYGRNDGYVELQFPFLEVNQLTYKKLNTFYKDNFLPQDTCGKQRPWRLGQAWEEVLREQGVSHNRGI